MKTIFFLIITCFSTVSYGQSWTKQYVTSNGDTIRPGTVITINKETDHILIDPDTRILMKERYRIYFKGDVEGKKYKITSIGRIRGKSGWRYTAHFKYYNPAMSKTEPAEFMIMIEDAIKHDEIAINK